MDWGTVVVGLAGISGSIVSAKMAGKSAIKVLNKNIQAENARMRHAEKRLLYAKYLADLRRLDEFKPSTSFSSREEEIENLYKHIEARKTAWATGEEIALIAPREVMLLALSMQEKLSKPDEFKKANTELFTAMRTDLNDD